MRCLNILQLNSYNPLIINPKIVKMKKLNLLLIIATVLLLSACSTLKTNTSKSMDIYGPGVIQNPVLVDLNVSETKVTGKAEGLSTSLELIKSEAIANALAPSNADVLIEPKFVIQSVNGHTTIVVTGYPATYKNFRPLKKEDKELLDVGYMQKAEVNKVKAVKNNNGKAVGISLASIAVVGGGILLLVLLL